MPPVVLDNVSSCRSSPIHWNPTPVPAPAFDGFVPDLAVADENVSWEHCIRILNNNSSARSARSLPRSSAGCPIFGSQPQFKRSASTVRHLAASSAVSRATSPLPSEFSDFPTTAKDYEQCSKDFDRGSLDLDESGAAAISKPGGAGFVRKIFSQLGKKNKNRDGLSRSSSSLSSIIRADRRRSSGARSPPPRLSCVGLTGDADPRISSANIGADAWSIDCERELGARHMKRWLQYQQWMAMVARAEHNLSELSGMLQYAVKSMADSKELDFLAEEKKQRQRSIYYAS